MNAAVLGDVWRGGLPTLIFRLGSWVEIVMKRGMKLPLLALPLGLAFSLLCLCMTTQAADPTISLNLRTRGKADNVRPTEKRVSWDVKKTAIIVCDMWDDHWCKSASRRVGEMAGPLNETLRVAREKGIFVIHAPSTCVDFYKDTPQRKRAQTATFHALPKPVAETPRWGTGWCWTDPKHESVLPIDDSDMGCDCQDKCVIRDAWKRQIATIDIAANDAISDNAQEVWNLLAERGIENVILSGVHLNMCVLGRPFGIRQMTYFGRKVALMRDMTDTMYNPERPPGVNHFQGTELVVQHVEKHWCPSFLSSDLTGKPAFKFAGAK